MRLIDADALNDVLIQKQYSAQSMGILYTEYPNMMGIVAKQPTIEAAPVVHGRWIPIEYDGYADGTPVWDLWECSECQEEHSGDEDTLTPYCPNCGARMDGDAHA